MCLWRRLHKVHPLPQPFVILVLGAWGAGGGGSHEPESLRERPGKIGQNSSSQAAVCVARFREGKNQNKNRTYKQKLYAERNFFHAPIGRYRVLSVFSPQTRFAPHTADNVLPKTLVMSRLCGGTRRNERTRQKLFATKKSSRYLPRGNGTRKKDAKGCVYSKYLKP